MLMMVKKPKAHSQAVKEVNKHSLEITFALTIYLFYKINTILTTLSTMKRLLNTTDPNEIVYLA